MDFQEILLSSGLAIIGTLLGVLLQHFLSERSEARGEKKADKQHQEHQEALRRQSEIYEKQLDQQREFFEKKFKLDWERHVREVLSKPVPLGSWQSALIHEEIEPEEEEN